MCDYTSFTGSELRKMQKRIELELASREVKKKLAVRKEESERKRASRSGGRAKSNRGSARRFFQAAMRSQAWDSMKRSITQRRYLTGRTQSGSRDSYASSAQPSERSRSRDFGRNINQGKSMRDQGTCTNDELFSRTERNGVWNGVINRGLCIQSLENVKKACDDAIEDLKFGEAQAAQMKEWLAAQETARREHEERQKAKKGYSFQEVFRGYERLGMLPRVQGAS